LAPNSDGVCPEYRLRAFFSVDLAGSTAFKAGAGSAAVADARSEPLWVRTTRNFYREFPKMVERSYIVGERGDLSSLFPKVWKTVGDEILLCCRIIDLHHLAHCVRAFLEALRQYGERLDGSGRHLDVKGAAWLAAFPHPNVTVSLRDVKLSADQFDEAFEAAADNSPRDVDFLGNGIDCGFRVAGRSATDRCTVSIELAWLLAEASERKMFRGFEFKYHDRHQLKGVLRDKPYPIFSLDTERSYDRQQTRIYEQKLNGSQDIKPAHVRDFILHFMKESAVELPRLAMGEGNWTASFPASYVEFRENWLADAESLRLARLTEEEAEQPDKAGGTDELPAAVVDDLAEIVDELKQQERAKREEAYTPDSEGMRKPAKGI